MMTKAGRSGKMVIQNMLLWVRKVRPTPTVLNAINQRLNTETAISSLRSGSQTFAIPTGTQSKISDHLFQGQMPKRIVLGFVENAAFNGDPTKKPVLFPPCQCEETRSGHQWKSIGSRPFEPDFANNSYLRSYLSLYQGLGKLGEDWSPERWTLKGYKNGYTLWVH